MKALVTGASSGMGLDMSKYLIKLGYDVIAVSSNKNKLDEAYKKYDNVKTICLDLTKKNNCLKLYDMVKGDNIDILVNNAGFGDAGNFCETSLDKELSMIDLNIRSYHILTKLFLKDFIKRDYGRILNIASMAGFMPGPYMATYYATKSYVVNLSLAIYEELKKDRSNVKISIFCPGPVKTNFDNVANVKFNMMQLDSDYASKYAIDNMFLDKLVIVPPNMKLNKFMSKIAPIKWVLFINSKVQRRKFNK